MESFFFNLSDQSYKLEELLQRDKKNSIKRVDISNGIVFVDINYRADRDIVYEFSNLDRMLLIAVVKSGRARVDDKTEHTTYKIEPNSIDMFLSSRQNLAVELKKGEHYEVFLLFIADFILKRYLSKEEGSAIDFLYATLQRDISLVRIDTHTIDAISLYIIGKIKEIEKQSSMNSLACEYHILEFLLHRFKLLEIKSEEMSDDELCISKSAKEILLKSFVNPPSIAVLAHLCATNETKLKQAFKKRYKMTIYNYIQNLRLQHANLLFQQEELTIGEVAKAVGYKHQGHFSKLFFDHYGVYPKELLKKTSSTAKRNFL
jgi:AraC-like DNA-binding protein